MRRVGVVAAIVLCGVLAQAAKAAELKVSYPELAALLRVGLKSAEIYLNNEPSSGLLALFSPKQSYVKVGTTEMPVVVDPQPALGVNYYVRQVNSTKISVSAVKQAVRVSVNFKTEGPAIVASSTAVPWLRWQNAAIELDFRPVKVAKGLSFEVTRVAMQGPFAAFCPTEEGIGAFACDVLSMGATQNQLAKVRTKVESTLKARLNSPEMRDQFAEATTKYLTFAQNDGVDIQIRDVRPFTEGVVVSFCVNTC